VKRAEKVFCDDKTITFERKLQDFKRDVESGQLKYFPNLNVHLENSTTFCRQHYKSSRNLQGIFLLCSSCKGEC